MKKSWLLQKNKPSKPKSPSSGSSSENPIGGWLIISILCVVAFFLDVPLGILIVAVIGYAISQA